MRASFLVCCLLTLLLASNVLANPSDKEPYGPLDLHGQEYGPEMHATAKQLYDKSKDDLAKIEAQFKSNDVDKIKPAIVGKTHAAINQLRRLGGRLRQLGEPAGAEFELRAQVQHQMLVNVLQQMKNVPNAQRGIDAIRGEAGQLAQARAKQIPKLQKLAEQNKWRDADRELYEIFDEIEPYLTFLSVEDRASILSPFREVAATIDMNATQDRKRLAMESLIKRRDELRPDFPKLLADVQAATASVGKTGKDNLGGKDLTGPELIAQFDLAWQQAHVAHCKALGVAWAYEAASQEVPSPERQAMVDAYTKFSAEIGPALAAIIKADTARVNAMGVAALYTAYLPPVADLIDHASGAPVEAPLTAALDELAKKSPEFAAQVAAYRAVTDETLRWKARVAAEQAKAKAAEHEPVEQRALNAFKRTDGAVGLFARDASDTKKAWLSDAAAATLIKDSPQAIGQKTTANAITALPGNSQAGIAQYNARIYTRVSLAMEQIADAAKGLETALYASEKSPPLSLDATRALRSAQRGDLMEVGGTIGGVYLEGHITRFATLPEAAALLLPLGTSPDGYGQQDQLEQIVLRFDLQPTWLRHKYFVVEVP